MIYPSVSPLRLGVLGLDARQVNLLRMFLRGPCQNGAVIVAEGEAEAYLVDLDNRQGARLLAEQKETHPGAPFIVLSLKQHAACEGAIFVQKPAQTQGLLAAIEQARAWAASRQTQHAGSEAVQATPLKIVKAAGQADASMHKVAMLLDEQGFRSYLGHRENVDPTEPAQVATLYYEPREYLQGYVQNACTLALSTQEAICMETPWKSLTILPQQRLVWIDADEAQLRAACGIPFRRIASVDIGGSGQPTVKVQRLEPGQLEQVLSRDNLMPLDALLWKIALWTSKGRIPHGVDLKQAARLKRWPNFTRLLVTPHALRIAALLYQRPYALFEAARILGIRQQYVFALFSAAHAQGLTAMQPLDEAPSNPLAPTPSPDKAERTSLLKKILHRLKMI